MAFDAYDRSLDLLRTLAALLKKLATIDPDLTKQMRRAAQNFAEGNRRAGKDRRHHFRVALGSAAEVGDCGLDIARCLDYLGEAEVAPVLKLLDRVRAMTYRLSARSPAGARPPAARPFLRYPSPDHASKPEPELEEPARSSLYPLTTTTFSRTCLRQPAHRPPTHHHDHPYWSHAAELTAPGSEENPRSCMHASQVAKIIERASKATTRSSSRDDAGSKSAVCAACEAAVPCTATGFTRPR